MPRCWRGPSDGAADGEVIFPRCDEAGIVLSRNLTDLADEPEGICLKDGYAYVVFHTSREPRHAKLWRFSLQ